ncbi:hypothetical protein PFISCL1PPCAC_23765 [Pristionchus fissidentatus]|uniref:Sodium/hydrogen exchanger n=1 Tax=Pristionchus fissidentatus TaxID=1538716 RepID=A0AAV5WPB9_9BILA|nr:hypothetical protein PFISCL1PPCAC_23765 [Pristionchus fissidentatus]
MFSHLAWHDVDTPLIICCWLTCIILAKIIFHKSRIGHYIPESSLLITLGLIAGYILDHLFVWDIYLHPDLFFLYLLPPIALEAGYMLPFRMFFKNIGTILLYAVVGTCLNILFISGILYLFSSFYQQSIPYIDLLLFSTLISAVDPVAVLSVFEEIHVNQLLYINVFGESLLNDAVVIVLYHSLAHMATIEQIESYHINDAILSFATVATGGVIIGLLFVIFTAFSTKLSVKIPVVQPLISLLLPYCCYLTCESVHMSGIIGIVTCGLMMKPYLDGNLSDKMKTTTKYFMKTLSNTCEAIVFLFLGLSVFSKSHIWDFVFATVTVVACVTVRFFVVIPLTSIANRFRVKRIALVDQAIISYGGLRGAICYGLVQTLDQDVILAKDMMITTTVVVIVFTVFIQGSTIKPLVRLLRVKTEEDKPQLISTQVLNNFADDVMAGIEAVIGRKGGNYYRRRLSAFNHNVLEPNLMLKPTSRGSRLVEKVCEMNNEEIRRNLLQEYQV